MPVSTSDLLQPIPGDSPGGAPIRYEPVFDQIKKARIEEADLPTGDWERQLKTADHALVIKLATEVLEKRSKDLQVASWLTEALLKREGFAGLNNGLEVVNGLVAELWDHLHPEIDDDGDVEFRAAPLEWLAQYLNQSIRLVPVNAHGHSVDQYHDSRRIGYENDADTYEKQDARAEAIESGRIPAEAFDAGFDATPKAFYKSLVADADASIASIEALDRALEERLGDIAPRFDSMVEAVREVRKLATDLLTKRLETDPDPVEPDEPAYVEEALPAAGGESGGEANCLPAIPVNRVDAEARVAAAARFLRSENPLDPSSYLLLRGFRWGELRVDSDGINPKLLAAPPTDLRARLRGLLLDARWAQLLEAAEEVMSTRYGRGWLDLQRYVLEACDGLGTEYDNVAASVRGALMSLLRDLPQLLSLVLMDDTPTANDETRAWLQELELISPPDGDTPAPRVTRRAGARGPTELAMERMRAGEPDKAIAMLIRQANQEKSPRERFLRRSEAAEIMVQTGRAGVALPILEELLTEIDEHTLESWESGEVVARPLGLLYRCLQQTDANSSTAEQLYLRICRLDPLLGMEITSAPRPPAE